MAKRSIKPAKTIYFKLEGNKSIKPQAFSGKEIAIIIQNLEESLRAVAKSRHPELDINQLYISLIEVKHDSNGLKFLPSLKHLGAAFVILGSSVSDSNYEHLPPRAVNGLKEIQKVIAHKEGCIGTFISGRTRISHISKSSVIEIPTVGNITGETILYGEIQRIGGAEPKLVLKLPSGDLLSVEVTEEVARRFGNRLYTQVGLKGVATWSYSDNKLLTFEIESLTGFQNTPINIAFDELRGSIGKYWDEIEDIKEAMLVDS